MKKLLFLFIGFIPCIMLGQNHHSGDTTTDISIVINPEYIWTRVDKKANDLLQLKAGIKSDNSEFGLSLGKTISGQKFQSPLNELLGYLVEYNVMSYKIYYTVFHTVSDRINISYGIGIGAGELKLEFPDKGRYAIEELKSSDTYFLLNPEIGLSYQFINKISFNFDLGYNITYGVDMYTKSNYWIIDEDNINFLEKNLNDFYFVASIKYLIKLF